MTASDLRDPFENDVEMYGAQTINIHNIPPRQFENDVEMYGAQTKEDIFGLTDQFENDVEMYGAQTFFLFQKMVF